MYNKESLEALKDIQKRFRTIFTICNEEGGISRALAKTDVAQPAIIMHLIVCSEKIQKLQDDLEINIAEFFTKEDIRELKVVRNIASSDYEGLNLAIVEDVIRVFLLKIDDKIENFFDALQTQEDKQELTKDIKEDSKDSNSLESLPKEDTQDFDDELSDDFDEDLSDDFDDDFDDEEDLEFSKNT